MERKIYNLLNVRYGRRMRQRDYSLVIAAHQQRCTLLQQERLKMCDVVLQIQHVIWKTRDCDIPVVQLMASGRGGEWQSWEHVHVLPMSIPHGMQMPALGEGSG